MAKKSASTTTSTPRPPKNLIALYKQLKKFAEDCGFEDGKYGQLRDCIHEKGNLTKLRTLKKDDKGNVNDSNFWFGFIGENELSNGKYSGLSYVIMPEEVGTRCLVNIGIGSQSIGSDEALVARPGFRRSFMRLQGKAAASSALPRFFFKVDFSNMDTSTPGLQEALTDPSLTLENIVQQTATKYNADSSSEAPGVMPAVAIVNYKTQEGMNILRGWLAQYAKWRGWNAHGRSSKKLTDNVSQAIAAATTTTNYLSAKEIYDALVKRRFLVLQGAPGCGKTWTANEVSQKYFANGTTFIQFHAETTYADFVCGIKPVLNGTTLAYTQENGILLNAIDEANKSLNAAEGDPEKAQKHLLIIDEFNRANLANVLGPVFYLFEQDSKNRTHKLSFGKDEKGNLIEYTHIPENLYVIATMNTADRSLAVVDFALRRRFSWITLHPHELKTPQFDTELYQQIENLFIDNATDEELDLQPGQSYFMDKSKRTDQIKYGLMPLMKEYFREGYLLSVKEEFAQLFYEKANVVMYE